MLFSAARMLSLDLAASWMVGDRADDLKAARNAGLAGGVHVLTGHGARAGEREAAMALSADGFRALAAPSIADAPSLLPLRRVDGPPSPAPPLLPRKREKRSYGYTLADAGH